MRPASIIFLVIGLLFVITGSVICGRAERLAADDGFNLLESATDENGNNIKTYEISKQSDDDPEVLKLAVKLDGIDLEITGGESRSYVEIYNKPAIFNCYISNKVMTVSSRFDLAEIVQASGSNFEFNGIRKYMDFGIFETKQKKVVVHLCDSDPLKQIELDVSGGNVVMKGIQQNIDIIVKSSNADVTMTGISTESIISVEATGGNLQMKDLIFSEMDLKAKDCVCSLDERGSTAIPIAYAVTSTNSQLTVNGERIDDSTYSYASTMESRFNASVEGGSLSLNY